MMIEEKASTCRFSQVPFLLFKLLCIPLFVYSRDFTMEEASRSRTATNKTQPAQGLLASQELYQYILETSVYPREPEPLKEIREATADHPWGFMATTPDGGQLMALLLKLISAKKTIEIDVFAGYSVLLTALVLPEDGKVYSQLQLFFNVTCDRVRAAKHVDTYDAWLDTCTNFRQQA